MFREHWGEIHPSPSPQVLEVGSAARVLDLDHNGLEELPEDLWAHLPGLKRVRMSRNRLSDQGTAVFLSWRALFSLETEGVSLLCCRKQGCGGRAFAFSSGSSPSWCSRATSSRHFRRKFTCSPTCRQGAGQPCASQLQRLLALARFPAQVLSVRANQIESLPEGLGTLTSLRRLDVAHNRISHLPSSLSACRQLEEIDARSAPPLEPLPRSDARLDTCMHSQVQPAV